MGTGATLACVLGAESTTTRGSCAGGSGGKGSIDGILGSARAGERTGGRADERGPWDNERRHACMEETSADKSTPPCSERERGERAGAGWRRHAGTTCQRVVGARAGDLDGLDWAGLG